MAQARTNPYVHIGWIKKLLVGESYCEWATWFKAHNNYTKMPGNFNVAKWKIEHTALVAKIRDELASQGHKVKIESQNNFKLRGQNGTVLHGQPDIVIAANGVGKIYDGKTGHPCQADIVQVMIYMWALPYAVPEYKEIRFDGVVIYRDHQVEIPNSAIDETFKKSLINLLHRISADEIATRVPSCSECGFCDITKDDCPERMDREADDFADADRVF
jgi:hypothetical protein